jgi:hypothetical protein
MTAAHEISHWWKLIPALPSSASSQEYHALRRVWGDHTISGARSFYRWGTEDNLTPALFQTWRAFERPAVLEPLLAACGLEPSNVSRVQWAYACEEEIVSGLHTGVRGRFVIPDIVLYFEDDRGPGVLAFEVKRPGKAAEARDSEKLEAYTRLSSISKFRRVAGCFIVSEKAAAATKMIAGGRPVVTWQELHAAQLEALETAMATGSARTLLADWISRNYGRCGVGRFEAPPSQAPGGNGYGSREAYAAICARALPPGLSRFLAGSECVECAFRGRNPLPPLDWLAGEISVSDLRARKLQKTGDRRIARWLPQWSKAMERAVP